MVEDHSTVTYREVPSFPGYRIGDDGSIWSSFTPGGRGRTDAKWRPLTPTPDRRGYLYVTLCMAGEKRRHFVHRTVLAVFVGPCPEGMEACHFPDRNPSNNKLSNLRWDTKKANAADKIPQGSHVEGVRCPASKLTPAVVIEARQLYATGDWTLYQLGEKFGVSYSVMGRAIRRDTWRHV